ncbi:MAG TPA: ABC transporter permease subunit [Acidimicrobiales bacterium]|jgi:NitT/TauT family transport system permease protein|nr:ABC transporter permease subunit [Acidimicrobiales bacterium]
MAIDHTTTVRPEPGDSMYGDTDRPSLHQTLTGLDALDRASRSTRGSFGQRLWRATWPKLIAFGIILLAWQVAVWAHWRPYILQSPTTVARQLWDLLGTSLFWQAVWATAQQAVVGFALVIIIGGIVGTAVARLPVLRAGTGALITGMQTLPSVLWYPLAYMVFGVHNSAIILMMVLGAAPSVANGFISGIDQVPPGLLRAGRVLGAQGLSLERHVVLPAALPSVLGGLKQSWTFGWHALMAGEFLILVNPLSLGGRTVNALTQGEYAIVVGLMIVIVAIGIIVDTAFSRVDTVVRNRYGLLDASTS